MSRFRCSSLIERLVDTDISRVPPRGLILTACGAVAAGGGGEQVQFTVPINLPSLGACLARFVGLIGLSAWNKRAERLLADAKGSPAASKVAVDYHWLELELGHL